MLGTVVNRRTISLVILAMLASAPVFAQVDLSGEWNALFHWDQPERLPGPELGDYLGLPINDAARVKAESWDASVHTLPERQCIPHSADYMWGRAAFPMRIWKEVNMATQEVTAWHMLSSWQNQHRIIYMDGRPHPSKNALHAWQGFSTGKWEGNALTITTTHLKFGYLRRNGVPRSDLATLTERYVRHGDTLTLFSVVDDPPYLTEPLVRTSAWILDLTQNLQPYPCEVAEEIDRPEGVVPHHPLGVNPDLKEFPARYGLPEKAARGGAETMYPEYQLELRESRERASSKAGNPGAAESLKTRLGKEGPRRASTASPEETIEVLPVRANLYMLAGAGGNIAVQVGNDGVLLVDAGLAQATEKVIAAIKRLSDRTIRYIVDTHVHPDHTGGNEKIARLGATIAGGDVANLASDAREGAAVLAHQGVLARMSRVQPTAAFMALPTDTYVGNRKDLFFNDEAVVLLHPIEAHTDGDTMVFFRRSDAIATGDIFNADSYPVIDLARGGTVQGEITALNQILRFAVSGPKQEGGTLIVPGHGRLSDEADVVEYRDMVTIVRDRVRDMIEKGMTLDQVKAARPTEDYDPRYGGDPSWTADNFIDAVYQSLKAKGTR
jgi:glyoxylase-like metal-dependent hydrolase (beta-lactamase superfamily II)